MKLFRISTFKFATIIIAVALIAGIGMPKNSDARDLTIVSWGGDIRRPSAQLTSIHS